MKTNKTIRPILIFLRELSVIVTGIFITVSLGVWINSLNNKNNLKHYLEAVVMELDENADLLDLYAKWMHKSVKYGDYIRSNNKNALNKDSLDFYMMSTHVYSDTNRVDYGCGYLSINSFVGIFTIDAFEMLKSSGYMTQIKDKELLSAIWEAYTQVEYIKYRIEETFRDKKDILMRDEQLLAEGKPVAVPMQIFYKYDASSSIEDVCKWAAGELREALAMLEKSKLVKR